MPPQDIDGLKLIIETLGESEKRYHVLFEQSPYGVLLVDDKGAVVEFNEAAHMQLGYSRAEFECLTLADLDPIETPDEIRQRLAKIIKDGKAEFQVTHKTKQGEHRDVHVITQTIVLSGRIYSHAIWIDITDKLRMERTQRESEEKFRTLFESAADGIMIISLEGRILDMNSVVYERLGYTRAELFGKHVTDIDTPEFASAAPERLAAIRSHGMAIFEIAHKKKDGTVLPVEVNARVTEIAGEKVLLSIVRDISDRKRLERVQRESEQKFRTLFESASDGILIISLDGRIIDMNSTVHERLGYTKAELVGATIAKINPPEFASLVPERMAMIRSQGKAIFESAQIRKDGTVFPVEVNVRLVELGGEKVLLSIARDITERKRAEAQIKTILRTAMDGFYIVDMQGRILETNDSYCSMIGYSREELLNMSLKDFEASDTEEIIKWRIKQITEAGYVRFDTRHRRKDGRVIDIEASVNYLMDDQGKLVCFMRDITERKKNEETLRESENKFRTLFESASDGIIIMSLDGRFLEMNSAAHERLGYTKDEMLGIRITDIDAPEFAALVPERIAKIRAEGKATFEVGHVRKDGVVVPMEASVRMVELGGEKVLLSIARDITERKRAEEAIRLSESRLAASQRIAHIGSWEWDIDTDRVHWSDEMYRIYGYQPREVSPDYALVLAALTPDSKESFLSAIDDALKGIKPFDTDYSFLRRDGSVSVLHTIGEVLRDSTGAPRRMVGTVQDITERKKAEAILRESEEKFRTIFDSVNDGILIADVSDRRFITSNRTIREMLGYTAGEILGLGIDDIHPKDALPKVLAEFEKQARSETIMAADLPVMRKDGSVFFADVVTAVFTLGARRCMAGVFRDTTERKRAEEALKESENRFQMAMLGANDGLFDWNVNTGEVYYSPRWKSMLGYAEDELEGVLDTWARLMHPDDIGPTQIKVEDFLEGRSAKYEVEFRMRHKDGHYVDILARASLVRGPDGERQRIVGTHVDITERRRMDEEIRESNRMLQSLMDAIPDMVFYRDAEGRFVMANRMTALSMGREMEDLIGKTNYDLSPRETADMCSLSDEAAIKSDKPEHSEESYKDPDGQTMYLDTIKTCIYDEEGGYAGLLAISRDITERKLMEEELRKSLTERETLLRELYHRTKNNMNVIRSLINLQTNSLEADERVHQMFRDLQNRIMSMSLVHERLYRSQDLSHVKLRDYVGDLTDALLRAYKVRHGSVVVKLDIGDFALSIDTLLPCGLVINELMANSFKYAFTDGRSGEISISGQISHDGEIKLVYADNGVGFPEGFEIASSDTLGLKLIKGLMTSQLRGKIKITTRPTPSFTFKFREPEYEKRL